MTQDTKRTRNRAVLPLAAIAALLLAGCSSGHVGESWQCPLAEGGSCDSVAAADPAVPDPEAARNTVLPEPLWRVRGNVRQEASPARDPAPDGIRGSGQAAETPCKAACDGGFDPLGWLARLFGAETAEGEKAAAPGPVRLPPPEAPTPAVLPAEPEAANPKPKAAESAAAHHPVEPAAAGSDADRGGLRTDEVVARIWIAPFVDAEGVYREASWVRAVLAPAGWRLGR